MRAPAAASAGVIEAERMADQNARVEFGRIEAGGAEFCGQRAPRRRRW